MKPEDVKIIFPLDVPTMVKGAEVLKDVGDYVDIMKIGHEFFWNVGNHEAIRFVRAMMPDKEIFADTKLVDIPNSVKGGAAGITRLAAGLTANGVDYFNIMATGGGRAIKEAVEESHIVADKLGI